MGCGFCESTLSNAAGTLVVDYVVKPVGRELGYLYRYHGNIEKLREKKVDVEKEQGRLQREIDEAERQLLRIEDDERDLLSKVEKILSDIKALEEERRQNKRCFYWCPNWRWRYHLSKESTKKTQEAIKLLGEPKNFGQPRQIAYRRPPTSILPDIGFLCSKDFEFSKSSKEAFDQIIEALKDDNISKIGLWGMGGVGKTTLVREVGKQAQELNLFDEVVNTTVSQKPNFEAIQDEIAGYLGFDMKNERGRRSEQELWLRLKKEKRILIILDDIWADINLREKIGIPLGQDHKGCKILLTTRRQQVCYTMDCQKVVPLGCLDRHEAWTLFAKKAGLNESSEDAIKKLANQIIEKCQGLPIAIVTLGSALKGKRIHGWEVAYHRLKNRRLTEIEDVNEENAYLCLETSFDYLKDTEAKKCFLLCSLFPEDYEIYVEDLVRYAWGLQFYEGLNSIEDVRREVLAAMDILKNSCLLLDCGERHVKMHDMVREVALWIASSRKEISFVIKSEVVETWPKDESLERYTAISLKTSRIAELPEGLAFPNLKILLLGGENRSPVPTSNEFFEGMKALNVCALDNILISPAAFQFQANLRTLHLKSCELSDISILRRLKTVQVFSFHSYDITELPNEIGDLENLRLLELSNCENLQRIPPRLIQRLSNLEELYLDGCGSIKWATENATQEESYSSLSELNSLPKLVVLSLDIFSEDLPKDFVFNKLLRFDVCIGIRRPHRYRFSKRAVENCPISRSLKIKTSVDACKQLLEDVESLELENLVGCPNLVPSLELDQGGFSKLTSLDLQSCDNMKCLIDTSKQQTSTTAFSDLLNLSLRDMVGLEKLCNGSQPHGFLQKLKTLRMDNCKEMICAIPILQNLEELKVKSCDEMQVLFQIAESRSIQQGPSHPVSFRSLKVVEIASCNKLSYLFPMSIANSLGQLETLKIMKCLELEEIIQGPSHLVSFQNLKVVEIDSCNKLSYLFPMSVANSLGQLETLKIMKCLELEEIIQATEVSDISLRSLRKVHVEECNNLTSLYSLSHGQSLENLTTLKICDCIRLEHTFPISMAEGLPQLKEACLENLPQLKGRDGNDTVLTLPCLQELKVENCPQLTPFVTLAEIQVQQGQYRHLSFQSLKVVEIGGFNNLRYLFPMSVANSLGQLEKLKIKSCLGLEEIIQATTVSEISLKSLKEVYVEECNNLTSLSSLSHGHRLDNLTRLEIYKCFQLEYTFPISMAEGLPQLNVVRLRNLPQLKGRDGNDIVLTLSSLQDLKVNICPQLTPFIISAKIQKLKLRGMSERKQMCNMIVPEVRGRSANMECLAITNFEDLFDSGYNLSSMRELWLEELPELRVIWKGPIQVVNFQNFTDLEVYDCKRLRFIFSSTIASNLPQLSSLRISECEELEQIIEKDQTSSQDLHHHLQPICFPNLTFIYIQGCENLKSLFPITVAHCDLPKLKFIKVRVVSNLKQVFEEGDEANVSKDKHKVIQLPRLEQLYLDTLSNLVGFSPVGYHFIFPSLDRLNIKDCPNITTSFSVHSKKSVHAKTEASQSSDEITVEETGTAQETTWPIGSDIYWEYYGRRLPNFLKRKMK